MTGKKMDMASEAPTEDEDADYKPILKGIINTQCNYDGNKIGSGD